MNEGNHDCGCNGSGNVGHPVVIWEGWVTNPARNNGADRNPLPVQPWHYGNFAAVQTQLFNGLQLSSFGHRDSYDNYLRLLQASNTSDSKNKRSILPGKHPAGNIQPSGIQLAQMVTAGAPNQTNTGGTGSIASGVDLNGRNFYG